MIAKQHSHVGSNASSYSIDYPNKDLLVQERAKLIEVRYITNNRLSYYYVQLSLYSTALVMPYTV